MGIYVLKASAIKELLLEHFPTFHDFGSDIIPGAKDLGFKIQVGFCLTLGFSGRSRTSLSHRARPRRQNVQSAGAADVGADLLHWICDVQMRRLRAAVPRR